jgi:hypothetical protein
MKRNATWVLALLLLFSACATTAMVSVRDLDFKTTSYRSILVISTFSDLMFKKNIEYWLGYYLQKKVEVFTGIDLLPPTRTYSEDEINEKLRTNGIEAILIASLKDFWESEYYVPQSRISSGSASVVGNVITYSNRETTVGGYAVSKPRVTFECRLIDAKTGRCAWLASTLTKGNALAGFSTLANSLAYSIASKLWSDGILSPLKK